jgi:hypothetical protein
MAKTNIIIKLSRKAFSVHKVQSRSKVKEVFSETWSQATAQKMISSLVEKVSPQPVRLLLADDVSYVVSGKAPDFKAKKERSVREQIKEVVSTQIPEELVEDSWDFKLLGKKGAREYEAFAPLMAIYKPVAEALLKAGYYVEVVEPELVAKKRQKDPIIGIFLKSDTKGRDEDVLSLEVSSKELRQKQLQKKLRLAGFMALVVLVMSVALAGVYFFYFQGIGVTQLQMLFLPANQPAAEQITIPVPEDDVETEVEEEQVGASDSAESLAQPVQIEDEFEFVVIDALRAQVQNGSGQAGVAGEIAAELESVGFAVIDTGNADSFEYENISVRLKEDVKPSDYVLGLIEEALDGYTVIQEDTLEQNSQYDVVLIVGS